ncbi:MAG: thiol-activated cytolysin family protein [Armatimonas sp.]
MRISKRITLSALGLAILGASAGAQNPPAQPKIKMLDGVQIQRLKIKPTLEVATRLVATKFNPRISVNTATSGRGSDANLKAAPTVEEFIDRLPEWGKIYPKKNDTDVKGKVQSSKEKGGDGKMYDVTKTPYSITTTPEEIVAFQPINGFWLGSMIQERGIVEGIGSFTEVPVEAVKRPRIKITSDLLMPNNVETVNNPSSSSAQQAVGNLISRAVQAKVKSGSSISYKMTDSFTDEQTAMSLGLDAHYMGASVKASLSSTNTATRHSISAVFIEKAFTVKADFEGRSGAAAFFNNQFTMDDARKLVDRGQVTVDNMPAYLASITYGRMLVFTMTADASSSDIRGAIQASYDAIVGGASVSAKYSNILKSGTTTITVTSVGGPTDATSGLIKTGKLGDFFSKNAALTTMVPISYTVNTVRENRLASMARTTEYTATTYNASNTFFKYNVTMYWKINDSDDGAFDNTVECYGEIRINGAKRWANPRSNSDQISRESGQNIDIGDGDLAGAGGGNPFKLTSDSADPTRYQISGYLYDSDSLSGDDVLLNVDNLPIKLEDLAGKGTITYNLSDILKAKVKAAGGNTAGIPTLRTPAALCIRVDKVAS